jgi:hypothetical protein
MAADPLDQTGLLADPFYELRDPLGRDTSSGVPILGPGQLVRAHLLIPSLKPQVLELQSYDPQKGANATFKIANVSTSGAQQSHFPIKELGLQSDENQYVVRGKFRPAIVLQTVVTDFYSRQVPEPYVIVAPCFTFKMKHTPKYRAQVASMKYPHLFYLPAHPYGFGEQGVLRFELIQPAATATVQPYFTSGKKQQFLTKESWAILQHGLVRFTTGTVLDAGLEQTLKAYGEIVMEAYEQAP